MFYGGFIMRKFIVFICAAAIVIILFNMFYECDHKWEEATCQVPKTCSKCGKTEGGVIDHHWENTDCGSPSPCSMCGTLEGIELTHHWQPDGSKLCKVCGLDERPMDVRFVESLGKALDARWKIMGDEVWYGISERSTWEKIVEAEREILGKYANSHFDDPELGEAAADYIASIDEVETALEGFGTEEWESDYYDSIRHKENVALYTVSTKFDIPVAEENREKLSELTESGLTIVAVNKLIENLRIHDLGGSENVHNYDVIMENNTEKDFARFMYLVEFYDRNEKVILTRKFTVYNWNPGEKLTRQISINGGYAGMKVISVEWE